MESTKDEIHTITLSRDDLCIAIAAQCAGMQKVIEMNEYSTASRYKSVTDKLMQQAEKQGLDVLAYVTERANEEREKHANADD